MSNISSEAKNYLARELGNHQRFLYEYGYVQIVDILEKGGFLCNPKTPMTKIMTEEEIKKQFIKYPHFGTVTIHYMLQFIKEDGISFHKLQSSKG